MDLTLSNGRSHGHPGYTIHGYIYGQINSKTYNQKNTQQVVYNKQPNSSVYFGLFC